MTKNHEMRKFFGMWKDKPEIDDIFRQIKEEWKNFKLKEVRF